MMPDESHSGSSPLSPGAGQSLPPPGPPQSKWGRLVKLWLKRLAITAIVVIVLGAAMVTTAEHKTGQPQFCGSCHVMEPYYESWQKDMHGGKLDVACIECHYAPGERTTIKAKLRGLSQVASYVSGRYGTSRPRAHVDNLSCLTSKCHADMGFMDKEISIAGAVKFVHAKHLNIDEQKQEALKRGLKDLTESLRKRLDKEHLEKLEKIAQECIPAQERNQRMAALVKEAGANIESQELVEFAEFHHMEVRLAQLANLQCTNCHSYGGEDHIRDVASKGRSASADHHFSVKPTACFTCHFTNEDFNTGTGSCLICHTLPTKPITVHPEMKPKESAQLKTPELAKQTVKMDHQAMLKRKVGCIACHADVATENSTVTKRDCQHCHDRPEYFEDWKQPLSLDSAKHYHALHVPEQRAKCMDCHSEIHHQLVRGFDAHGQPSFLSSVMADCTACHPNQHVAQIELLSGMGGVGVSEGDPNLMFGLRTNCLGCHTNHVVTKQGDLVVRAAASGCVTCHGERYADTFKKWKQGLELSLMDAGEAYEKASKALAKVKDISPEVRTKVTAALAGAQADLQLVKTGNGVHNVMYSMELLDSVTARCQQVTSTLAKESSRKPRDNKQEKTEKTKKK
jgi:nitrate/TMAO reductase-like tetraheme cytochrome c subunit